MNSTAPGIISRLFRLWLCAVLLCAGVAAWAWIVLSPEAEPAGLSVGAPKAGQSARNVAGGSSAAAAPVSPEVPSFDAATAQYTLTAFSVQGMQHVTDAGAFDLLLPGNVLTAQLIKRGPTPEPLTEGVTLRYILDPQAALAEGHEAERQGQLSLQPDTFSFASQPIPVLPYTASPPVAFAPYPQVTVEARDSKGGLMATTRAVLPVSTEMGCLNCHTGAWKTAGAGGVSDATAGQILQVHDKRNRTRLAAQAAGGKKVDCRACHGGNPERMNLSTAVHGFHASMGLSGQEGCASCHPASEKGTTRFSRDIHAQWGLECTNCHGTMEQHAASLLLAEEAKGKSAAASRMKALGLGPEGRPALAAKAGATPLPPILPRTPWVNLPHCTGCHDFAVKPQADTATAFNKWTKDASELYSQGVENTGKLRCPSCHGSPHAVYPASGPLGDDRDNLQPLQYQKAAAPLGAGGNCAVCHMQPMEFSVHHDMVE